MIWWMMNDDMIWVEQDLVHDVPLAKDLLKV